MSSSTCISSTPSILIRLESESESRFPRPSDSGGGGRGGGSEVRVVDSKSCRQMYLRTAYKFSRQEDSESIKAMEKAKKCLDRVRDKVYKRDYDKSLKIMSNNTNNNKGLMILIKVKEISFAAVLCIISRMLACTSKVGVAEH